MSIRCTKNKLLSLDTKYSPHARGGVGVAMYFKTFQETVWQVYYKLRWRDIHVLFIPRTFNVYMYLRYFAVNTLVWLEVTQVRKGRANDKWNLMIIDTLHVTIVNFFVCYFFEGY